MALTNNERIAKGLDLLRDGLGPKCGQTWDGFFGEGWLDAVNQRLRSPARDPNPEDLAFLLNGVLATWNEVFGHGFPPAVRALVFEAREARNKWAHQGRFTSDDAGRALDSMERLLEAFGDLDQRQAVRDLRRDLLRQEFDQQAQDTHHQAAAAPSQPTYGNRLPNSGVSGEVDKQPTNYALFGASKPWRSGIGMWVDVVEQVYSRHERDFLERAERLRLTPGSRRVLISGNPRNINRSKRTRAPGIYVEYSLTQTECVKLAYKLLEMFGHPASDLHFNGDHAKQPTYSGKSASPSVSREDELPTGYTLFGVSKSWRSGIGMWVDVVEQVYSRHERDFLERAERLRLTPGSRRVLISGNPRNINRSKRTRAPGIYVEYSLTQAECVRLAYQLLKLFGHLASDLVFRLD